MSELYVLGHVTECDDPSEDGGPLWEAEVQTIGGYGIAAALNNDTPDIRE